MLIRCEIEQAITTMLKPDITECVLSNRDILYEKHPLEISVRNIIRRVHDHASQVGKKMVF